MISLDELVLDMRDIMELSYFFYSEKEEQTLNAIHDLLKVKLEKFHKECYLISEDVLNESLFYASSFIKAYQEDEVLLTMATEINEYIKKVIKVNKDDQMLPKK